MDKPAPVKQVIKVRVLAPGKRARWVEVRAEYYRIGEHGELVFRNHVPNSYPETVHLFAAGVWQEIKRGE